MRTVIKNRLEELGITLPKAQKPKVAKIKGWSIVGNTLYCEPFAFDLTDGSAVEQWSWNPRHRSGCGTISASATTFFFRDSNPSMFDLGSGEYSKVTTCSRPGCWINMIPAGGLLLVPEASSGCTCNLAIQSSMAFLPVRTSTRQSGSGGASDPD